MKSHNIRVTKIFTFDIAHALYGYDGLCKNIHGHTYHLGVTICGIPDSNIENPKLGMVMDFGSLKDIINKTIIHKFDHVMVLNQLAGYAQNTDFLSEFERVVLVPFQPTCENLLNHFVGILLDYFRGDQSLVHVKLSETPTSYCEWCIEDH
ncbi:MAG: 6-carboxytetrahydropterin synthase [Saprospiraceae bacterium]